MTQNMPNAPRIYDVKCPSCGAPLTTSGERITCDYCGSVLERERPPREAPATAAAFQEPQVVVIQAGHTSASFRRNSGGSSCLSSLFVLILFVGLAGVFAWTQFPEETSALLNQASLPGGLAQLPGRLVNKVSVTALTGVTVLPGGDGATPDFLTFAYPTGGSTYSLAYVESLDSTIRWQSPPLKESYNTKILQSPEAIYFTDETRLYALNRQSGQTLWQSALADKLPPGCPDCFHLIGGYLVALVQGGTVQGFDTGTGQRLWSHRLNAESLGRLIPAGERLLLFDRTADNRHYLLLPVDPATGPKGDPISLPECAGEFASFGVSSLYDPEREALYLLFNGPLAPPCLQSWALGGPTLAHTVSFEGLSVPMNMSTLTSSQPGVILAGGDLYLSANQTVDGIEAGVVAALNPADGSWRVLTHAPDYRLVPLATADHLLLVRAIRSRGTARSELWGIDLASGESRWQYPLQAPRWAKDPGAGDLWDWHLTPNGLAVLQVLSDPDQVLLDVLDPQTGVSPGQKTIPVSDSFFTGLTWTPNAVWLALRQIHKIDLESGSLTYTWP